MKCTACNDDVQEKYLDGVKCGACNRKYRGHYCNECHDEIAIQEWCANKEDSTWFLQAVAD